MAKKLTGKQERFVDEYCSNGFNGTKAVVDAGYKVNNLDTAAAIAYENLRKPQIVSAIAKRKAELAKRCEITIERQLQEYEKIKDDAMEKKQYNAAIHALDSQTRIIGGFERDNIRQGDDGLAKLLDQMQELRLPRKSIESKQLEEENANAVS